MTKKQVVASYLIAYIMSILLPLFRDVTDGESIIITIVLFLFVERYVRSVERKKRKVDTIELEVTLDEEQAKEFVERWNDWMKEQDVTIHKGEKVITKDKAP